MAKPTKEERQHAKLHATVWENVFNVAQNASHSHVRSDVDWQAMATLAMFALIVGGEYRKIGNGAEIDE